MDQIISSLNMLLPDLSFDIESVVKEVPNVLFIKRKLFGVLSFIVIYLTASSFFVAFHRTLMAIFDQELDRNTRLIIYIVAIPLFIVSLFLIYLGGAIINILMYVLYHI